MSDGEITHDYSRPAWGHDCTFRPIDGGQRGRVGGWGRGVEVGHMLILDNAPYGTTRYRVDRIDYAMNPPDQWFADVTFAPRAKP